MFSLNNIRCSFGARVLFKNVSFSLSPGERAGLVGPNGAGKTTLLRIMAGLTEPDHGRIIKPAGAVTGYLPQELTALELGDTVWEEACRAFEAANIKARELENIHRQLATATDEKQIEILLRKEHELSLFLENRGFHQQEARAARVLSGLGFRQTDFHRPLSQFSGGWKMRASLARILLSQPDLLLLDEPTNHLDLDSVTWLEEWLVSQKGALLMVSHDECFLNRLSRRIISLEGGTAVVYHGNHEDYLKESRERKRHQEARQRTREARIRETERFIQRFRAKATKARQVQSRIRMLQREQAEQEQTAAAESAPVRFRFPEPERSGRMVAAGKEISKRYPAPDNETCNGQKARWLDVFSGISFAVERGEHIAVVGPNGSGKSTLARIIAGITEPDSGTMELGYNVTVSYFGQHQAMELPQEVTVLEAMRQMPGGESVQRVRDLLGAFLFHGDMVNARVASLSGGEKSRLALARMLLDPANFLILDEPTNHLDIASKKVLKEALRQFSGSFLLVSHDRAFMQGIISKVWEMRDGRLSEHLGGIEDYLHRMNRPLADNAAHTPSAAARDRKVRAGRETDRAAEGSRRMSARELRRRAAKEREIIRRKLGPLQERLQRAEAEVQALEERKEQLEALLADPAVHADGQRMKELNSKYRNIMKELDKMYLAWEEAEGDYSSAAKLLES